MPAGLRERRFRRSIDLKVWWVGLASVICCGLVTPAGAADGHYSNISPDQHLKDWLLLGPIPVTDSPDKVDADEVRKLGFEKDLLKVAGGEANVSPKLGDKLTIGDKECAGVRTRTRTTLSIWPISWVQRISRSLMPRRRSSRRSRDRGSSAWEATMQCAFGSMASWSTKTRRRARRHGRRRCVSSQTEEKGTNRLLIKVLNDQGDWGFTFRFLSPEALSAKQLFQAASDGRRRWSKSSCRSASTSTAKSPRESPRRRLPKCAAHERVVEFLVSKGRGPAAAVRCRRGGLGGNARRDHIRQRARGRRAGRSRRQGATEPRFRHGRPWERRPDHAHDEVPHRLGHQAICRGGDFETAGRRQAQRGRQVEQVLSRFSARR